MGANDTGFSTLLTLSKADRLNTWMFEEISPYLKGAILEIGSGLGNISSVFIRNKVPLYLSDFDPEYSEWLKNKFSGDPFVKDIFSIDLAARDFANSYAPILGKFDSVFALNVVEHIEDDMLAVQNCAKLLAPGGRLVILVPAYPALYSSLDKELDHFRRYTRSSLEDLLSSDYKVLRTRNFNFAGIFGWWVAGHILRKKRLTRGQMRLYDKLVPLFRLADRMTFHSLGLSVIGVAEKKG